MMIALGRWWADGRRATARRSVCQTAILLFVVAAAMPAPARAAWGWDDITGGLDMPWLGSGERAWLFSKKSTCMMCPTGYTIDRSWGTSGRSGEDPYDTVASAMRFLHDRGVLATHPEAIAEGSVGDGREIIEPRALPYRFTIVMIEPTVVVMRFDLGALVKLGPADDAQVVGTPRLNQAVEFGTRIPDTGTLLWFAPAAGQTPAPVALAAPDRAEIVVKGVRLVLERREDTWTVAKPVPAR